MKICYAASEIAPFAKTGGLADVVGSLPQEIRSLGHEVFAFLPRYQKIDVKNKKMKLIIKKLPILLGAESEAVDVYCYEDDNKVKFYFIDNPELYCRDELYGTPHGDYPDNDIRFILFQRAVLEVLKALKIKPDIIHCHDWQTGLIPVYLKTLYAKESIFQNTKSVFTIHNLAYQGNFPPDSFPSTGFSWDLFKLELLEFFGKFSFLKGGIVFSDRVTTVSQSYADEIQTKEYGCGLEGALKRRKDSLFGIINGIDYEVWNPKKDPDLPANFDEKNIKNKALNKKELQTENGFSADSEIPLIGFVSRLVDQKGVDILVAAFDELMGLGVQIVLLGTGEERYHQMFRDIAKHYKKQFGLHIVFDSKMAKRIYAGSDILMIPSYYEPCGLAQMIALRYGTIPLVRAVGGLDDTVEEFNPETGKGNGFKFEDYTARALMASVKRGLQIYRDKEQWKCLIQNAMACDFSWTASAKKYVTLYEKAKRQEVGQ